MGIADFANKKSMHGEIECALLTKNTMYGDQNINSGYAIIKQCQSKYSVSRVWLFILTCITQSPESSILE